MAPIAPVLATCVPPHAERSKPSTSMSLSVPWRLLSFRDAQGASASSEAAKRMEMTDGLPIRSDWLPLRQALFRPRSFPWRDRSSTIRLPDEEAYAVCDGKKAVEGGRQHVLSGMLLHVIEAPLPIDQAANLLVNQQQGIGIVYEVD